MPCLTAGLGARGGSRRHGRVSFRLRGGGRPITIEGTRGGGGGSVRRPAPLRGPTPRRSCFPSATSSATSPTGPLSREPFARHVAALLARWGRGNADALRRQALRGSHAAVRSAPSPTHRARARAARARGTALRRNPACPSTRSSTALCGQRAHEHDRDVAGRGVLPQRLRQLGAVHQRHHQVRDDQIGLVLARCARAPGRRSPAVSTRLALVLQDRGDQGGRW